MNYTKVLFIWKVPDPLKAFLQQQLAKYKEIELIFPPPATIETKNFKNLHKINIMVGWLPTKEMLYQATQLSLFINPGAGVQHLLPQFKEQFQKQNITLVNGHGNAFFTAQHAVAMLLSLCNQIIPHHQYMMNGQWRTGDKQGRSIPLRNKTVGLLGYGAINQKVHQLLSPFDLKFIALKRQADQNASIPIYTPEQLYPFLKATDILIMALPQTEKTKGMIDAEALRLLGPQALLINVARGPIIDEAALFKALNNQEIQAAALDVWYNYRPEKDQYGHKRPYKYPFHDLKNVILSPHRAASPLNDLSRWEEVVENITRFAKQEKNFLNQVTLEEAY